MSRRSSRQRHRQPAIKAPALPAVGTPYLSAVSIDLVIGGTEEAPRWCARVGGKFRQAEFCCPDGHWTPEAAASHGAEKAAAWMITAARALPPGTVGGDLLAATA